MPTIQLGTLEIHGMEEIPKRGNLDVDICIKAQISIGYRQIHKVISFYTHTHMSR